MRCPGKRDALPVKLNIGIDVQPLQYNTRDAGIGYYIRNLLREIRALPSRHTFHLVINNHAPRHRDLKLDPALDWPVLVLDRSMQHGVHPDIDLFHSNSIAEFDGISIPRPAGHRKVVVTVHDTIPVLFREQNPAYWSEAPGAYRYDRRIDDVRAANAVLTVSNHSRKDIVEHCGIPAGKVFVTHNGIENEFRPIDAQDRIGEVRRRLDLPRKYILYVGGYYNQRKNIRGLLSAYRRFLEVSGLKQYSLVLAGANHARASALAEIREMLDNPVLEGQVLLTDFVPDADLPVLYSEADVFFYPSLYEGFGLTPLQAMACGTPVIASDRSAMPEIAGTGAELVDPEDIDAMAQALVRVATDPGLRNKLVTEGHHRACLFSWNRTATRTLEVYEQVLGGL